MEGLLFRDLFGGNDSILFARVRCLLAAQRTGFNLGDFNNYPKWFRNDSIVELAQAGVYQGVANIEEYVKFAYDEFSPYLNCCEESLGRKIRFIGYENGQCEFLSLYTQNIRLNPSTTAAPSETVQFLGGLKIYLDFEQRYFKRFNVFFTDDFLRIFIGVFLNSENTQRYVCGVADGVCASTLNVTANANNLTCEEQLLTLPAADGGKYYIDGKSQGCRALHAVFAATNPMIHCAHLSYTPLEDPNGSIKCQTSKGTLPSSLFTERELQMLKDYATSKGLDPELGHNYIG